EIRKRLETYFGWRLALSPDRELTVNGVKVEIPECRVIEKEVSIDDVTFQVDFIRWINKPGDEKSYNYVVSNEGRILHRALSSFNNKPLFYLSTYARSDWFDNFDKHNASLN